MEPYENTLSVEELRREVRDAWNQLHAINHALMDLPETDVQVFSALSTAAMNIHKPDLMAIGKEMQRRLGLKAVPPKTEYECAAGLWSIIRAALLNAANEQKASPTK